MNGAAQPLVVLQLTDTHLLKNAQQKMLGVNTEKYFLEVLQHALAENHRYDLLLLTGDLAQEPGENSYQRLFDHLKEVQIPVVCLPGNHDNFDLMQHYLNSANVSCKPHHLYDAWQIICLNSQIPDDPGGFLEDRELAFLEQCLRNHPEHHALIAVHHHCIPTRSAWMDTMMIGNSARFLKLLQQYQQVKAVITGHIHQVLTERINNLRIFGTPSTCFQFTPKSPNFSLDRTAPGYREILLFPEGDIETSVKRLPNELHELNINGPGYFDHH